MLFDIHYSIVAMFFSLFYKRHHNHSTIVFISVFFPDCYSMHIFTKWSKHISWKIELIWFELSSNEQLHVNIKYDSHCQEVTSSYWLKKEIIFFFYREKTQSFSFLLFLNICLICKHTASTITFSKTIHCISCKKKL